uniref:Ubiquitin-like protease family profile domain-containing protein n=1 Tax=Chenopodium quinoa TaxID=63459 RepID=A0A803MWT3_CHEQI
MTDREIHDAAKNRFNTLCNVTCLAYNLLNKQDEKATNGCVYIKFSTGLETVRIYDDLRDVSNANLSTWEEQYKNSETNPKTNQEDVGDPKTINLNDENEDLEKDLDDKEEDENKEKDDKEEDDNKEKDDKEEDDNKDKDDKEEKENKEEEKEEEEEEEEVEEEEEKEEDDNKEEEEEEEEEEEVEDEDKKEEEEKDPRKKTRKRRRNSNVISLVTESILKDTPVEENHPTLTEKAIEKTIESDANKQLLLETNIVFKDIHQEIVPKVKINLDCGEKDVEIDLVSKTMKDNKSRMNEMLELYQVVVDYCFVKYSPFKNEEIVKFEGFLMIFAPICLSNHYNLIVVNFLKESIQYLDNREYDEKDKSFYRILGSIVVEEMSNFLKIINHEKADEILEYEFDEINFKWKTPRYTLDCGVFAMIHMLCFSGDTFDYDLELENRRKVYRAEICAAIALADINTKRRQLVKKVSRFRVVRKLEKEKEVEDMIRLSNFLKKHKEVMENMSLKCHQVIDYLTINDDENFPNKSEVVDWFIDSIEIVREDYCNALLNEWKVSSNLIITWANHLNNNEMQRDRAENDLVRFFFGFDFMDALTMCLNAHGKKE